MPTPELSALLVSVAARLGDLVRTPDLAVVGTALALATALIATLVSVRALRAQRRAEASLLAHLAALDRDLGALCSSATHAGDRLVSVERRARDLLARQERTDTASPAARHYRHAAALLRRGATAEELVQACGMARGEAELVAYLHQADAAP